MSDRVDIRTREDASAHAAYQRLRRQYVEGRLTLAEFDERVEILYASWQPKDGVPASAPPGTAPTSPRRWAWPATARTLEQRAHLRSYVLVMALLLGIWAVTGMGYFWPIWPMMGWGIGLAADLSGGACGSRRPARPRGEQLHGLREHN